MFQIGQDISESEQKDQKLRLKRFRLGVLAYFIVFLVSIIISSLSTTEVGAYLWAICILFVVAGNVFFYLIFKNNLNLKFRDKSLTKEQIIYSGFITVIGAALVPEHRALILMLFIPALSFGMLWLNTRQYLSVVCITLVFYAVMLGVEFKYSPRNIVMGYEILLFCMFAIIFSWFAYFGSRVSNMREQLKEQNSQIRDSNEKYKHERDEKEKAHNLLKTAIHQTSSGVIIAEAPDIKISFVNQAAYMIRSGIVQDFKEKNFNKDGKWQTYKNDGVTPYPFLDLPLARSIKYGEIVKNEELIVKDNNQVNHNVLVNSAPVFNRDGQITSGIVIFHDITEHKESERNLKAAHKRFIKVLNSIDATIYVADLKTNEILFMNKQMIELYGRDMTGEICHNAFCNEMSPCFHCINGKLLDENGEPADVYVWQNKNKATGRWFINYDRAIEWTDGEIVKLQIATDITEFKKMESDLRHAHKMESVGTLAGGIAHDFNNILSIILGNAELSLNDLSDIKSIEDQLNEIKGACMRARDVVKQLLSFSRKTDDDKMAINIVPVIRETVQFFRSTLPSNIEVHYTLPDSIYQIHGDASQIHQILLNICTNSFNVLDGDGGLIEIDLQKITIGKDSKYEDVDPGEYVELIITDTGSGIDSKTKEKMFDPYFSTKEFSEGSGMGLAVVHGIIKNHNGFIFAGNREGEGASFTILLPLVKMESVTIPEVKLSAAKSGDERVLFLDDEKALVDMAKTALSKMGYKVEGYTNPEKALAAFLEKPQSFDIAISDMTMPRMSGLEFTEKVKKIRDIPVIICTGHSSFNEESRAKDIGISDILMKPVTMGEVAKTIRGVIDN
jgi:signal transduction histidine kinase